MLNRKKLLCALAVSVCLVTLGTGTAFAGGESEQPEPQAKEVTLRIFARAYTWDQEAPWEVAKAEIQKRHPDTKFTFVEEGFGWADLRGQIPDSRCRGQSSGCRPGGHHLGRRVRGRGASHRPHG